MRTQIHQLEKDLASIEGTVMLKNDGAILPLNASPLSSIAVLGPLFVYCKKGQEDTRESSSYPACLSGDYFGEKSLLQREIRSATVHWVAQLHSSLCITAGTVSK